MIIVNGWKPLTIITKPSILDVAAALDPPLLRFQRVSKINMKSELKARKAGNNNYGVGTSKTSC